MNNEEWLKFIVFVLENSGQTEEETNQAILRTAFGFGEERKKRKPRQKYRTRW